MNILFFMCSIAILSAPLYGQGIDDEDNRDSYSADGAEQSSLTNSTSNSTIWPKAATDSDLSHLKTTESPVPASQSQSPPASTTTPSWVFTFKKLHSAYMVAGGLILLSFVLLISTLLLAFQVCRLNRRIKELSGDTNLVVTTEYQGAKDKPEKEVEETTVLMSDLSQTKEEMGNGTAKEEVENKTEDGDKNKTEEAAADVESSSPPKGPEETNETPSAEASAASNSDAPEEAKDVV